MNPIFAAFLGLMVGMGVGSYITGRRKSKELDQALNASDGRWRVAMSNLISHLLCLGYETQLDGNTFLVDAPGDRLLISMSIHRFDPETLLEGIKEGLPPASEWLGHREGEDECHDDTPPSVPSTDSGAYTVTNPPHTAEPADPT